MTESRPLPDVEPDALRAAEPSAIAPEVRKEAARIVDDVRARGEPALREHAVRIGDVDEAEPMVLTRRELRVARDALPADERAVLERTAERIATFARFQMSALRVLDVATPFGRAGHDIAPVERAGCYAPGGRYPLPSSVLMTAVTARTAGVDKVWVASPNPNRATLAAAAIAGADGLLAVGGAHAIGALAYGAGRVRPSDVLVGPGSDWVTAAKRHVAGDVRIDMLAGPSELLVLADEYADPALIAADLLAQAEHDVRARPILVTTSAGVRDAVQDEIARQLETLPTADVAREACANGAACLVTDLDAAVAICDRLAPEHLQLMVDDAQALAPRFRHYGGLFIGARAGEVLGDYGAGPNHVLPTGGAARTTGGLSALTFLRVRTWLRVDDANAAAPALRDTARLAEMEGLHGHAEAARRRL